MTNPVQDALAAAAAQVDNTQTAQAIEQPEVEVIQAVQAVQPLQPAVAQHGVSQYQAPAAPMSIEDAAVSSVSGVSNFVKLRDGGLELDGSKFGPVDFDIIMAGSDKGGSYQPVACCNYNSAAGQVYTKSYDQQTTVSNNPAHNGLPWHENILLCQSRNPSAYSYIGFELTLKLSEDTISFDCKTTITKGTLFGYTTPYTASKLLKALWDKANTEGKRGETFKIKLSGEEVKNDKGDYKKLILEHVA